jgi:hypothetical protein
MNDRVIILIVVCVAIVTVYYLLSIRNTKSTMNETVPKYSELDSEGIPVDFIIDGNIIPRLCSNDINKFTPAEMNGFQRGATLVPGVRSLTEEWYPLSTTDVNGYMWDNMRAIQRHMLKTGRPVVAVHREKPSFEWYRYHVPTEVYALDQVDDGKGDNKFVTIIGWSLLKFGPDQNQMYVKFREPQAAWILAEKDIYGRNIRYLRGANFNGIEEKVYGI